MTHRISKKTRERAALICSIAACEPPWGRAICETARDLGLNDGHAESLALQARYKADETLELNWPEDAPGFYETACAEAEALLRCGREPSNG